MTAQSQELRSVEWYHSIRLPDGSVTPGRFDTLDELRRVPLPASLEGRRCLDVGTADGFWAFEMERRGAESVVALDIDDALEYDWPGKADAVEQGRFVQDHPNHRLAFEAASRAFGSRVERHALRVYDLDPVIVGTFDFVFMGSLLLHLRDPVGALMAIRRVAAGTLLSVDSISPLLTLVHPHQPIARLEAPGWPLWWVVNLAAYRRMFAAAGFETVRAGRPFPLRPGPEAYRLNPRGDRPLYGFLQRAVERRLGVPHAWVLASADGG